MRAIAVLACGVILVLVRIGRCRRWPVAAIVVVCLAALLRIWTFNVTHYDVRPHDLGGHLDYFNHIINEKSLPKHNEGWQGYQPPAYYLSAVLWAAPFSAMTDNDVAVRNTAYQMFSLLLSIVFVGLVAEILLKVPRLPRGLPGATIWSQGRARFRPQLPVPFFLKEWFAPVMGIMLACFWPGIILHCVRIGNDALLYPLLAASLMLALRWHSGQQRQDLTLAVLFAGLGLLTKASAIVLFAVIGIMLLVAVIRSGLKEKWREIAIFGFGSLVAATLVFGPSIMRNLQGQRENIFVGNVDGLDPKDKVSNRAQNYLFFDVRDFITTPFASVTKDPGGRQYFFNYYLKTSLFGEFGYSRPVLGDLAIVLSLLLLLLLAFAVGGALTGGPAFPGMLIIFAGLTLLTVIMNRISSAFPYSTDFRYTVLIVIPLAVCAVRMLDRSSRLGKGLVFWGGTGVMGAFCLFSAWFILAL